AAGASCTYAEGPPPVPLLADLGGEVLKELQPAALTDGPVCGSPPHRFDADLLRVRRIRVVIRAESESAASRGRGSLFTTPGLSLGGSRTVPDQEVTFDVAPRSLNVRRR